MPRISTVAPPVTKAPGVRTTEFQAPEADGLVGDDAAALEHHFLNITEPQAEAKIQPDALRDDLDGEAISPVAWCSGGSIDALHHAPGEFDNTGADQSVTEVPHPLADSSGDRETVHAIRQQRT